ncbi:MAG: hypothetical protein ACQERB_05465 [Promethearchaeati archaeon]
MVKIKIIDGIPCIILEEDLENKNNKFIEWKERNNMAFFFGINETDSLREALKKIKDNLDKNTTKRR